MHACMISVVSMYRVITVMTRERHGVSNQQQFYCLFNRSNRCTSKKTSKFRVTGHLRGETSSHMWIPTKRGSNAEIFMLWRHPNFRRGRGDIYTREGVCRATWFVVHMLLTHSGRDKMAAISQTSLSSAFSWIKMFEFRLEFHWGLFLRV